MKSSRGRKLVAVEECGGSTRGHVRNYDEIRLTPAGVLGTPPYPAGAESDGWELVMWRRICGVSGIEDPSEVPDEIVMNEERASELRTEILSGVEGE